MGDSLPAYVNWGGDQTYPQPLTLQGCIFRGYVLDADPTALSALCDRYLNQPGTGREFHPLVPYVFLGVADIQRISCSTLPADQQFWLAEVDVAFWVPLISGKREGPVFVAEEIGWFQPYLIVNQPWAYVSGRELYGFPKEFGTIVVPPCLDDPASITVDTMVVPSFGPDSQVVLRRLIEVQHQPDPNARTVPSWSGFGEALQAIVGMLGATAGQITIPGLGLLVELYDLYKKHEMPLFFLKQFRDIADGRKACYQAVARAPAAVTAFRVGGFMPGTHDLTIGQFASHPIVADLGLTGPNPTVRSAWYIDFDFTLGNGTVYSGA